MLALALISGHALSGVRAENVIRGDFTNDGEVTSDDAIYLLRYTLFPQSYPVYSDADFTNDGSITSDDAIYLLRYTLFPASYPIGLPAQTAPEWGSITKSSESYYDYSIGAAPYSLMLSYYDGVFSRGFSWITSPGVTGSSLYVVPGSGGANADFTSASAIEGTHETKTLYTSHKAWVTGLAPSAVYSYKVGSPDGWAYGVFMTDSASPASITAIQISDAQTKKADLLYVWENTMAQAVETAGRGLDMILYNGDQFDAGLSAVSDRGIRHAVAKETVRDYVGSVPYMPSSGNHEPTAAGVYVANCTVDFGTKGDGGYSGVNPSVGGYYSFDYAFAHFIVLDSYSFKKTGPDTDQLAWLEQDLADAQGKKWIIVVMHVGAYSTGDHSDDDDVQNSVIPYLTPLFSEYHVDLVLQAHDHTYSKTLPYKWDAAGYTASYHDTSVVNFDVVKGEYNGAEYDIDPPGTYYVTTGAAGHRAGASAGENDGVYADVTVDPSAADDSGLAPVDSGKTYLHNTYKTEVGVITSGGSAGARSFEPGDPATGNVDTQMFGVLNLTADTMTYDFYTVEGDTVTLFDSLRVYKSN